MERSARKLQPGLVEESSLRSLIGCPDESGHAISHVPETLLAFADLGQSSGRLLLGNRQFAIQLGEFLFALKNFVFSFSTAGNLDFERGFSFKRHGKGCFRSPPSLKLC